MSKGSGRCPAPCFLRSSGLASLPVRQVPMQRNRAPLACLALVVFAGCSDDFNTSSTAAGSGGSPVTAGSGGTSSAATGAPSTGAGGGEPRSRGGKVRGGGGAPGGDRGATHA